MVYSGCFLSLPVCQCLGGAMACVFPQYMHAHGITLAVLAEGWGPPRKNPLFSFLWSHCPKTLGTGTLFGPLCLLLLSIS